MVLAIINSGMDERFLEPLIVPVGDLGRERAYVVERESDEFRQAAFPLGPGELALPGVHRPPVLISQRRPRRTHREILRY